MSVSNAFKAVSIIFFRNAFSSSSGRSGLPTGCGMETAGTTRFAPTEIEIGVTVHTWTIGIPALSMVLTIVAPQRVQVPHVEVRMAPCICSRFSSSAMASPNNAA